MSVIKNNGNNIEYYNKIYITHYKKTLIKLIIRQIINIIRKIRKKVKTTLIGTSRGMMKAQRGSGWCKELFDHL